MTEKYLKYVKEQQWKAAQKIAFLLEDNRLFRLGRDGMKKEIRNAKGVSHILAYSVEISQGEAFSIASQLPRKPLSLIESREQERKEWEKKKSKELEDAEEPLFCRIGVRGPWIWAKSLLASLTPLSRDHVYKSIQRHELKLYQWYFNEIYYSCSVESGKTIGDVLSEAEPIIQQAKKNHYLNPVVILAIVLQYIFADELIRQFHRNNWVQRVLHRDNVDFFPDSRAVVSFLQEPPAEPEA